MLPKVCRMNHKNLVFALLKTIQNKLGAILDVFCDYLTAMIGCFLLLRDAQKPKFLLTLVSPIRVCPETLKKKVRIKPETFLFARLTIL